MRTLLIFLVLSALCSLAAGQAFAPNTTICTPGVSPCIGTIKGFNPNCVCQNGGICNVTTLRCQCPYPLIYNGSFCEFAQCVGANYPNGCVHGTCIGPGVCQCNDGWQGFDCSMEINCTTTSKCDGSNPSCLCQNGAKCVGLTNSQCQCTNAAQYAGAYCQIPQCGGANFPGGCHTGQCVAPATCSCNPGWNGTDCGSPICQPLCIYGYCIGAGVCQCNPGFAHCPNTYAICGCDENECERGNPPCDSRTTCTNYFGGYSCSACPAGYPGSGYIFYPGTLTGNFSVVVGGCNATTPLYPTYGGHTEFTSQKPTSAAVQTTVATTQSPSSSPSSTSPSVSSPSTSSLANNNQTVPGTNFTIGGNATTFQLQSSSIITQSGVSQLAPAFFLILSAWML